MGLTTATEERPGVVKRESSAREKWRAAFFPVIEAYQETKSVVGTCGAINYAMALTSPATNLQVPGHTRPSLSDFIADVEISARQSLTDADYEFFVQYFVNLDLIDMPTTSRFKERAKLVAENVGRRLIANKVFPLKGYMQGKVVKINRGE